MSNNIFSKIAIATVGATLSLAVNQVLPGTAATFTYDFTLYLFNSGETDSSFRFDESDGSFSFDESAIIPPGADPLGEPAPTPFLVVNDFTDFRFDYLGKTFTESNSDTFRITFSDERASIAGIPGFGGFGVWDDLTFEFSYSSRGSNDVVLTSASGSSEIGYVSVELPPQVTPIPESGGEVGLIALGVLGLAGLLRKNKAYLKRHRL